MSEEEKKGMLPEQERYVASFAEAMRAIEAEYKKEGVSGKAYQELKRKGMWDPHYIAMSFVLISGKLSPLSKRLRDYITTIGALANMIFEKSNELSKKNESEKGQ